MDREEIVKELSRIVRSKNNDAVKLAWMDAEQGCDIGRLDLRSVTEIKRSERGVFEVKFVDRLKALELLERLCQKEESEDLGAFLEGLRDGEGL